MSRSASSLGRVGSTVAVVRLWALRLESAQAIGALVPRALRVREFDSHPQQWRALVEQTALGEEQKREVNGQVFSVRPTVGEKLQQWTPFDTPAAVIEFLAGEKTRMKAAGWVEVSLDPINDPD